MPNQSAMMAASDMKGMAPVEWYDESTSHIDDKDKKYFSS